MEFLMSYLEQCIVCFCSESVIGRKFRLFLSLYQRRQSFVSCRSPNPNVVDLKRRLTTTDRLIRWGGSIKRENIRKIATHGHIEDQVLLRCHQRIPSRRVVDHTSIDFEQLLAVHVPRYSLPLPIAWGPVDLEPNLVPLSSGHIIPLANTIVLLAWSARGNSTVNGREDGWKPVESFQEIPLRHGRPIGVIRSKGSSERPKCWPNSLLLGHRGGW